jgi:hypothetical protein
LRGLMRLGSSSFSIVRKPLRHKVVEQLTGVLAHFPAGRPVIRVQGLDDYVMSSFRHLAPLAEAFLLRLEMVLLDVTSGLPSPVGSLELFDTPRGFALGVKKRFGRFRRLRRRSLHTL